MAEIEAFIDLGRGGVSISFDNYGELEVDALERKLSAMYGRHGQLPSLLVRAGEYVDLLVEARRLYEEGHFYSCVAMAGITGERILKDMFLASIRVVKGGKVEAPTTDEEVASLEGFEAEKIRRFLLKSGIMPEKSAQALQRLMELRNKYAHAGGREPSTDSQQALKLLMDVVDGTVCLLDMVMPGFKKAQEERSKKEADSRNATEVRTPPSP